MYDVCLTDLTCRIKHDGQAFTVMVGVIKVLKENGYEDLMKLFREEAIGLPFHEVLPIASHYVKLEWEGEK